MLLNRLEFALMNNPVRSAVQRRFEAVQLFELGGPTPGAAALELGCGRGVGVEIVLERFGAGTVDAFDLDSRMVVRARQRLLRRGDRVRLWVGDASLIPVADATYEAVFDFGILHHVPDWRRALREVHRVLKPGGRFYAEEVLGGVIRHPVARRLFDHPQEDRFGCQEFLDGLQAAGLIPMASRERWGAFAWFAAVKPALP